MYNIFSYAATNRDEQVVSNLLWKVNLNRETTPIIEVTEKEGTRIEFENMLDKMSKGDILVISSVASLNDGDYRSLMRNIRKLEGRGVILKVELETDFTYASYEAWYKKQLKIEEYQEFFNSVCCPPKE